MSLRTSRSTACAVVIFSMLGEHRLALVGGVLVDDAVEVGIDVGQRGDDHRGQPREEAAVEPAEGVAEVADGGAEHRADDVELGRVVGVHLGGPRGGQAAAGVAPQSDGAIGREVERRRGSARRARRRARGSRVRRAHPRCRRCPRGRGPTPPSPRRARPRSAGTRTGPPRRRPSRRGAARRTGSSARRPRRSRTGRTRSGSGLPQAALGGHDDGGDGGLRGAVEVGGAVEQLGGA